MFSGLSAALGMALLLLGGSICRDAVLIGDSVLQVHSNLSVDVVLGAMTFYPDDVRGGLVPDLEGAELGLVRDVRFTDRYSDSRGIPPATVKRWIEAIESCAILERDSPFVLPGADPCKVIQVVGRSHWQSMHVFLDAQAGKPLEEEYRARWYNTQGRDRLDLSAIRGDVRLLYGDSQAIWFSGDALPPSAENIGRVLSIGGGLGLVPVNACDIGTGPAGYLAALKVAILEAFSNGTLEGCVTAGSEIELLCEDGDRVVKALDLKFAVACVVESSGAFRRAIASECLFGNSKAPDTKLPGMSRLQLTVELSGSGRVFWEDAVPGSRNIELEGKVVGELRMDTYSKHLGYESSDGECLIPFSGSFKASLATKD